MSTTEECQASESPGEYWEMAPLWDWGKKGKKRQWDPASPGRPPRRGGACPRPLNLTPSYLTSPYLAPSYLAPSYLTPPYLTPPSEFRILSAGEEIRKQRGRGQAPPLRGTGILSIRAEVIRYLSLAPEGLSPSSPAFQGRVKEGLVKEGRV